MTLRKRLDRLGRGKAPGHKAPIQVVLYGVCSKSCERVSARITGGASLTREVDETEPDFIRRVTDGAALTLLLPDNGR